MEALRTSHKQRRSAADHYADDATLTDAAAAAASRGGR